MSDTDLFDTAFEQLRVAKNALEDLQETIARLDSGFLPIGQRVEHIAPIAPEGEGVISAVDAECDYLPYRVTFNRGLPGDPSWLWVGRGDIRAIAPKEAP